MEKNFLKTSQDNIQKLVSESDKYSKETSQFFKHNHTNTHTLPRTESLPTKFLQQRLIVNDSQKQIKSPIKPIEPIITTQRIQISHKIPIVIETKIAKNVANEASNRANSPLTSKMNSNVKKNMMKICTIALNLINKDVAQIPSFSLQTIEKNSLQFLNLSSNKFKGFPEEIKLFPNLKSIKIDHNFIKILPHWLISSFKSLEIFSISDNLLQDLTFLDSPDIKSFGNSLKFLDISFNHIDSLHQNLQYLKELRSLRLHNNDYLSIPVSLRKLKNLQEFTLDWFKYLKFDEQNLNESVFKLLQQRFSVYFKLNSEGFQDLILEGRLSRLYIEVLFHFLKKMDSEEKLHCYFLDVLGFFLEGNEFSIDLNRISKENGQTLMHKAVLNEEIGVIKSLIFYEFEHLNLLDHNKNTGLSLAIQEERYFAAKILIYNGADVEIGGNLMGNCLNLATIKLQIFLIEDLLKFGANPNCKDPEGNSPLHYLSSIFSKDIDKSKKIMGKLLEKGADPNIKNQDLWSPIHLAVKRDQLQALNCMVSWNNGLKSKRQSLISIEKEQKNTGNSRKIKLKPFKINKRGGSDKWTALHIAVSVTNYEILKVLLENKADIYRTNINNLKAVAYCRSNGVLKLLRNYEKRVFFLLKNSNSELLKRSFLNNNMKNLEKDEKYSDIDDDRSRIIETVCDFEDEKVIKCLVLGCNDINKIDKFNKLMQKPSMSRLETKETRIFRSKSSVELTNMNKIFSVCQAFHNQYKNLQFSLLKYQKLIVEGFLHYSLADLLGFITSVKLLYYRLIDEIKILEGNSITFENLQKLSNQKSELKEIFQVFKESYYTISRNFIEIIRDLMKKYRDDARNNKEKMRKLVCIVENILGFVGIERRKGKNEEIFAGFLKEINEKIKEIYGVLGENSVFLRFEIRNANAGINWERKRGNIEGCSPRIYVNSNNQIKIGNKNGKKL